MSFRIFLLLFFATVTARADLTVAPRYDYILGKEQELANRFLVKSKLNSSVGPFGLYLEGFSEFEGNEQQRELRRSAPRGYLQEAYFEFKLSSFFVRVGRQALRWSESWTVPSLDIWTGRRWNRLFFDPLAEQLTHPTGASFSYAKDDFSLDLVGIGEVAETVYPEPLPEVKVDKNTSFGGRAKWMVGGFGLAAMTAQSQGKNYYGFSGNYAFDQAVPKFELGTSHDGTEQSFATLGCDVFLGNWILLPQLSTYEVKGLLGKETQSTFYLSVQWNPDRHDVQLQAFHNLKTEDSFVGASYGYNLTDYVSISGFVQNYQGNQGLYKVYEDLTGGTLFGVRFEVTGNLAF